MTLAPLAAERRNRSMKGDVKKNISPPTGRRNRKPIAAASPFSVETKC